MRILIAHSFYRVPGGEDRLVRREAALLSTAHEVECLFAENRDLSGPVAALRLTSSLGARRQIKDIIERFGPDLVHVHNLYPALGPIVPMEASRRRIPIVMTVHNYRLRCPNGLTFTEGSPCERCVTGSNLNAVIHRCFPSRTQGAAYAFATWAHRAALGIPDKISVFLAPSRFVSSRLETWGVPGERIRIVPNFTDPPREANAKPGRYGLYLGRLSSEKGLEVLLEALRHAGDPPFRIAGDGPEHANLLAHAARLGLARTSFLGMVGPHVARELLVGARFVAIPSLSPENAPLAALEGMAAGRPLVVSDRGGLPELVATGSGFVSPAEDRRALAEVMEKLFDDDDRCARAGTRGLMLARDRFAPEAHRRALEDAYSAALAG